MILTLRITGQFLENKLSYGYHYETFVDMSEAIFSKDSSEECVR